MQRPSATLILIISSLMAFPAIAGQMEDAANAYNRGDYKTAYRLYKPLAEQGSPEAQYNLGVMYDYGNSVSLDNDEAVKWFRKAAEQGYDPAMHALGVAYLIGEGIPQNYVMAYMWFSLARPEMFAPELRELLEKEKNLVAAKMTPAQLAEGQKLASEWKPKKER